VESWDTILGNVDWSRGISAAEALNTRFRTTHSLHLPSVKDKASDKDKDKDKDSEPSNHIRIEVGRRPTPPSRTGHLNKSRPDVTPPVPRAGSVTFF